MQVADVLFLWLSVCLLMRITFPTTAVLCSIEMLKRHRPTIYLMTIFH